MIRITMNGDHDQPEWLITINGMRILAHQPLGSVMRARLQVYRALAAFRQHENSATPAAQREIGEVPA